MTANRILETKTPMIKTQTNELTPALRERHQVGANWQFGRRFNVRWSEVDSFSHANHAAYFGWIEETRNLYLADAGYPLKDTSVPGPILREVGCVYERSLSLQADVLVTARTAWMGRTSFRMDYAVWSEGLIANAFAICIWMLSSDASKRPIPQDLRTYMQTLDGAIERVHPPP
ncbi:acyl-CoA thioesterase [Hydrogenophaga sp.]|uniref:acyl-CoA thioesterase n=1 Tax=Hydrogenophaga sp. TaxID=1904254 RepID=UPI0027213FDB|nr:acyl-CoA thioesterase [Hydrogenophaga sp.]MDO9436689.1 acyl-CoA thioesterase [Hydrogenophaga sp.]